LAVEAGDRLAPDRRSKGASSQQGVLDKPDDLSNGSDIASEPEAAALHRQLRCYLILCEIGAALGPFWARPATGRVNQQQLAGVTVVRVLKIYARHHIMVIHYQ
jgi:hypothetical protein